MEPQTRLGTAKLTRMAFGGDTLSTVRAELVAKCLNGQASAADMMDLSTIDQLCGNPEQGMAWQMAALQSCRSYRTAHNGRARRKRALVLTAPAAMGTNTPVDFLLEGSEFEVITHTVDAATASDWPAHDIAFCAVPADDPTMAPIWDHIRAGAQGRATRILNLSQTPAALARGQIAQRLNDVPQVHVPQTRVAPLNILRAGLPEDCILPFLIRPRGAHAGKGLRKIDHPDDLGPYLAQNTAAEYEISTFIDYASADSLFRKYRIVFVDGQPYPCHMAIADHWDIWYLNAEMEGSPAKRAEEAAFFQTFHRGFAPRHRTALRGIADRVGLDYFGIDCAEGPDGRLVVFEADNALLVHDMDCPQVFPYKVGPMREIFAAFEAMLLAACDSQTPTAPRPAPTRALTVS